MRVSVVIATCNRAASLRVTLDALRHQTHGDFEVVVVEGPCDDETPELLAGRAGELKMVTNPELNLCKSRNLGIDATAGDVVAFIDDDGIPEPEWLERLAAGYDDDAVGGVGGLVYDETGATVKYRWSVCDRVGETWFDREPPLDDYLVPGADPFLYLQGTNMSFRREALEAVLGFDENIEFGWDEAELALHLIDGGWKLRQISGAGVLHRLLPSHTRDAKGIDPFTPVKNRTYFALRNGPGHRPLDQVFEAAAHYVGDRRAWAEAVEASDLLAPSDARRFVERLEAGFELGVDQGLTRERAGRPLAPRDSETFVPYPTVATQDRPRLCFVSLNGQETADIPRSLAARGHEVHVVTRSEGPPRLDFEDGVWVHRRPEPSRDLPALDDHPLRGHLAHCAEVWHAVDEVDRRFGLDFVMGNVQSGETLFCALDPRWHTGDRSAWRDVIAAGPPRAEDDDTNAAEVVRGRLPEILTTFDVADPDRSSSELLEPSAYPRDYWAVKALLEAESSSEFVSGLYRVLLDREPDSEGLERYVGELAAGTTRLEVLEQIVRSD